jgi:glycine/D-amino acid oxidase-like deaminating enzyme
LTETAEAVIIGGGVMGCSILYHLAARGMTDSLLLERDLLGSGSTGRSSGAVRMHYSTEVHARMAWHSLQVFRDFDDRVGGECGYTNTGYLVFAGEEAADSFRANLALQQRVGIETAEISRAEAAEIAPGFFLDDCAGIAYEPLSGHADPSGTALAFAARARELGARTRLQLPAVSVETESGRVTAVVTGDGRIETGRVIVATGPWSRRFLLRHGIDLPLTATRHEVVHLKRPLDRLPYHPGGGDIANLTYFRPEGADLTLVGNGNIEQEVDDPEIYAQRPSQSFIQEIWTRLARRIPLMADAEYSTGYAGLYTSTPDSHPVMDRVDGVDGLYVCTGFSGHGFKLSPAVGLLMAELVLDGRATTIDISPLRMSRFAEGDLNLPGYGFKVLV